MNDQHPGKDARPGAASQAGGREQVDLPSTLRLADYLEALWRRKGLLLGASLGAMLAAGMVAANKPNVYRSQARLMVSAPRETVDASRALGLTRGQAPFSPADSALAVLQSRDLMERVVRRIGPAAILAPEDPSAEEDGRVGGLKGLLLPLLRFFQRSGGGQVEPDPNRAVAALRGALTIHGDQRSPSILVVCRAASARRAQAILQAFVEEGLRFYIELRSSEGDRLFVEEQRARSVKQAEDAQQAYRAFLEEHRIVDFRAELEGLMELYTELDRAIGRDRLERETLARRALQLERELEGLEPFNTQPAQEVALPNPNVARLEEQLLQRDLELQELRLKAAAGDHPQIREKEQQIALIRARLGEERGRAPEVQRTTAMVPNPEYERRRNALLDIRLELQSLESSLPGRVQAGENALKRIQELGRLEERFQELRGSALRTEEHKAQIEGQLRSFMLAKDLDARGLSNLQLVESPTLEPGKEGPAREKFLLAGFLGALGVLSPALMLGLRISTRLRRARQIEELLGVAVPATLPRLDRKNLRRFLDARDQGWI